MAVKIKPKVFGPIFVTFDDKNGIQYGWPDQAELTAYPPSGTPVETLVASLGSCIVESVRWSANQHKVSLHPFKVKVIGTKAPDLPGRIETMDVTIIGDLVEDETLAPAIVKQAKAICTVSNSLNCQVNVTVEPGPAA